MTNGQDVATDVAAGMAADVAADVTADVAGDAEGGGHVTSAAVSTNTPRSVVLLGAQRFEPTLGSVVDRLGIRGRIALITAGWQEREAEDDELSAHLGGHTVNLALHARGNAVFAADHELSVAHRERQVLLRHLQEIYRIRLEHAFEAERDVAAYDAPAAIREEVRQSSIEAIRTLDAWHVDHCLSVHDDFERRFKVASRPAVQRQRDEIARALADCSALAIAGGHVAVLLNRLDLFDLHELIGDRTVFAWSAGAMAVGDRVVLFHDDPPEGRVARQVLDVGLRLIPRAIALPEPERRLDLTVSERVALQARRFAPSTCLALPARSYVIWQGDGFVAAEGAIELCATGETRPFAPPTTTKHGSGSSPPASLQAALQASLHAPIGAHDKPETTSTTRRRKNTEARGEGKHR